MYESDYEDEAQFTEETLQDGLRNLLGKPAGTHICGGGCPDLQQGAGDQPARRHRIPADHCPEPLKHSGPG